ncbi:hypothetical protein PS862_05139 [Pseudomonas fluorescens]|uniref:Uncharacterized protein n=2 Tax=Pseudomonas fluorescens TaxID=294 RepID=A0A5E7P9N9_PSEFL|nr:hypothetical protein PS862_05139 [Pseudomonas fluorescens]
MSLGHNKVKVTETEGPKQLPGQPDKWAFGIRAMSTFTGQPAEGVSMTILSQGVPSGKGVTDQHGWNRIIYFGHEGKSLRIFNLYDGSTA